LGCGVGGSSGAAGRRAATTKPAKYNLDESAASEINEDMVDDKKRTLYSSGSEMSIALAKKVTSTKSTKPKKSTVLDSSEGGCSRIRIHLNKFDRMSVLCTSLVFSELFRLD